MPRLTPALLRVIVTCFIWCQRSCLAALALPYGGSETAGLYRRLSINKHYRPHFTKILITSRAA